MRFAFDVLFLTITPINPNPKIINNQVLCSGTADTLNLEMSPKTLS